MHVKTRCNDKQIGMCFSARNGAGAHRGRQIVVLTDTTVGTFSIREEISFAHPARSSSFSPAGLKSVSYLT